MSIPDSELQLALHEYQEWGEKLRTPRDIRISALLSNRSEEEIATIMRICEEVEAETWKLASAMVEKGLTSGEALQLIQKKFPFMSPENASRTCNLAGYYTLKL